MSLVTDGRQEQVDYSVYQSVIFPLNGRHHLSRGMSADGITECETLSLSSTSCVHSTAPPQGVMWAVLTLIPYM